MLAHPLRRAYNISWPTHCEQAYIIISWAYPLRRACDISWPTWCEWAYITAPLAHPLGRACDISWPTQVPLWASRYHNIISPPAEKGTWYSGWPIGSEQNHRYYIWKNLGCYLALCSLYSTHSLIDPPLYWAIHSTCVSWIALDSTA